MTGMDESRAIRALTDIVAIEKIAPGLARVVTWSDTYTVDARGEGCTCPDKEYNLLPGELCKHHIGAVLATTDIPSPYEMVDSLTERPRVATDGGTSDGEWMVIDHDNSNELPAASRSEAEEMKDTAEGFGSTDVEIVAPSATDGGTTPEPVEVASGTIQTDGETIDVEAASTELPGKGDIGTDPLEVLPSYMIDDVQGTPTLNKRGLSVLAFHYGVTTTNRDIIASPHETGWESAIVETTVENSDGNTFVGTGTAHVERGDDAEILLELAETRSYKRAVSFATGTGIVSYQEMVGELE